MLPLIDAIISLILTLNAQATKRRKRKKLLMAIGKKRLAYIKQISHEKRSELRKLFLSIFAILKNKIKSENEDCHPRNKGNSK
jgi:hypothetical protein